jgi:hypothetical protein
MPQAMVLIPLIATLGAAALPALPAQVRTATATMGVGATVVRPQAPLATAVEGDTMVVRNAGAAIVSAQGGTVTRTQPGTIRATADGAALMVVTLTY